jgi:Zn finger protein HypA/HybF involved in hydrogenase expression
VVAGVVRPLNSTLEQELFALLRGASLECLVCGEFVMHVGGAVVCPECRSQVVGDDVAAGTDGVFADADTKVG